MVQSGGRFVDLHEQLVALTDEAELQVLHLLVGHNGCCLIGVEVLHDDIFCINEHVVAHQCVGRFLRLRVELIAWLALVVQIDLLAVSVRYHFQVVVLLALDAVEAQVSHQTGLVASRALRGVSADELLRQSLGKEHQFVHVTLQWCQAILSQQSVLLVDDVVAACTDERIAAADAA